MGNHPGRLALHRETVRHLADSGMSEAGGGLSSPCQVPLTVLNCQTVRGSCVCTEACNTSPVECVRVVSLNLACILDSVHNCFAIQDGSAPLQCAG